MKRLHSQLSHIHAGKISIASTKYGRSGCLNLSKVDNNLIITIKAYTGN